MTRVQRHKGRVRRSTPRVWRPRSWRRWLPLVGALLLVLIAPVIAFAQGAGPDSVILSWTSPGDDGNVGTAAAYEMRMSISPINAGNWSSANMVGGLPVPAVSGTGQNLVVRGLSRDTTYYFAIRSGDDAGNWSPISNVVRWDWLVDTAPPSAPNGLTALRETGGVHVSWADNSEPDLQGYTVYRATAAGGPFAAITGSLISVSDFIDSNPPTGVASAWYQVTASDYSGNESAASSSAQVALGSGGSGVLGAIVVEPGFPNPSKVNAPVSIPVVIPPAGPGGAAIDIVDAGGRHVRRIVLSSLSAGRNNVLWDGKNESGRDTVPGVYHAWLSDGGARRAVKLVRVP